MTEVKPLWDLVLTWRKEAQEIGDKSHGTDALALLEEATIKACADELEEQLRTWDVAISDPCGRGGTVEHCEFEPDLVREKVFGVPKL